jgi:hypothetical protein
MPAKRAVVAMSAAFLIAGLPLRGVAEVTSVTIATQTPVAGGRTFGDTGAYEQLTGRIEFALDPADPHNAEIVDLSLAPRSSDGRVHFSSDLFVQRPSDRSTPSTRTSSSSCTAFEPTAALKATLRYDA